MMNRDLELTLNEAIKKANELKHEYLSLENVFYFLLDDLKVDSVLRALGSNIEELKSELLDHLSDDSQFSLLQDEQIKELNEKQFLDERMREVAMEGGIKYQPELSLSLQRVLQRAAIHVQSAGKKEIHALNVLVAIFQEEKSLACYLLHKQGITRLKVIEEIAHGTEHLLPGTDSSLGSGQDSKEKKGNKAHLLKYCVCLNELATQGKLDPLVGREDEITRVVQILSRRRKNNPLLVGDAGVGKTAIAEGLALKIVQGEVPEEVVDLKIFALEMSSLLAGAKFRGDFEQRLKGLMKEVQDLVESGQKIVLFIDEIHTVMGAGATGGGSMDAGNILKPALSRGDFRLIGSTTFDEYRKHIEKDSAFSRRFQKVDVSEPSLDETFGILKGLKAKFENFHGVLYKDEQLKLSIDLADRFLTDRFFPDKAIDILDEVGARVKLSSREKKEVFDQDIEDIVSNMAKIPQASVKGNEKSKLKNLVNDLSAVIYGQDEAITKVSDAVLLARAGLNVAKKPTASFLFMGPTGVGKTELATQLGRILGMTLSRYDMSEYMEKHAISKFIGAPPGYVGHEEGGILTDFVRKNPYSIILLDEIEKAHPDIHNILLQIMDNGELTDSQGRKTDFTNSIIVMTSNVGALESEKGSIGLSLNSDNQKLESGLSVGNYKQKQALKRAFTPEFRNRLDGIISFNPLSSKQIFKVVEKFLTELEGVLLKKGVSIKFEDEIIKYLADKGFDSKMGARPIKRIIDQEIKKILSHELIFGDLQNGGEALISLAEGVPTLKVLEKVHS